jgi:hypothetical protein
VTAYSQQTVDEWEDFVRFRLTMWSKADLQAFADRGPAEQVLVAAERERRRQKSLSERDEKERVASP